MNADATNKIKSIIHSFMPDAKILLFGSYARGEQTKDSDYDLLVITKEIFSSKEKINWMSKLNKALVKAFNAPFDVLINSEEEVSKKKELPGHVIQWAVREGIEL